MDNYRHLQAIAAALLPIGLAGAAAPAGEPDFEAASIHGHIEFLADDLLEGRAAGTRGYDIAASYVASAFRGLGLEPAGNDGFLQHFDLIQSRLVEGSGSLALSGPEGTEALETPGDYMLSGSYLDAETALSAPITFVGFGVTAPELGYDDYAGLDVSGHVLAMFGGAPATFPHNQRAYYSTAEAKYPNAVERGAVGLLVFRTREHYERYKWETTVQAYAFPGMRWVAEDGRVANTYPQLEFGASLSPRGLEKLLEGTGIDPESLYDQAEEGIAGGRALGKRVEVARLSEHQRFRSSNVAAVLRGSDPDLRDEYVVITAHLDHIGIGPARDGDAIYNGAYDNAAGVAIMLEVARALAESETPPARSILFLALGGEEKGLLGSDYFAEYPTVPMDRIVANVNIDMPLFIYPLADVVAFGAQHSSLKDPVERAAARAGLSLSPDPMPEEVLFIRSDQYPFVRKGVPAVFLVSGFTSSDPDIDAGKEFTGFLQTHYHQPSDDVGLPFNDESALAFTRAKYHMIRYIADDSRRPTWNEGDFFGEKFGRDANGTGR
jgi:hypothetical protein